MITESHVRVRYAETDQMGVVYHANYLIWMEIGRTDYCRACGFRYADMERDADALLVVAEVRCRYVASARYDDELVVRTTVKELRSRMVVFYYTIHRKDSKVLLAEGETTHIVTNKQGRPVRFPTQYMTLLSGEGK